MKSYFLFMGKGFKVFIINAIATIILAILIIPIIWLLSEFTAWDKDNPLVEIAGWILTIFVFIPLCGWLLIKFEPKENLENSLTSHSSGTR